MAGGVRRRVRCAEPSGSVYEALLGWGFGMNIEVTEPATPAWLSRLRNDVLRITTEAAREHWPGPMADSPPYYNYRLEHVQQVEREALRLGAEVGGDPDIILASVWIHDRFQPQYDGPDHAARAAEWAEEHLAALGFPRSKVGDVCFAVANHSNPPHTIPAEAKEARLLWDADKLSKIGAINVVAFLCANPAFPKCPVFPDRKVTYANVVRVGLQGLERARARVEVLYFEPSQVWARERLRAQTAFYEALAREVGLW